MKKFKDFLNNDRLFFRVAFLGLIFAMFAMFNCLDNSIDNVQDDVRVIIRGNQAITCTVAKNGEGLLCTTPDYKFLLDTLY
jgi:hypothetical protein